MPENEQKRGNSPFEDFGRKVDEHFSSAMPRMEDEVRKVITYLNDEVVPKVRQNSSEALRVAAEQFRQPFGRERRHRCVTLR